MSHNPPASRMKAFYTDHFVLPLPPDHRFPMRKYSLLRERVLTEGVLPATNLLVPDAATDAQILLAHDADYLEKVITGTLSRKEIKRIGFPWSPGLVERSRRSSGATICAARAALVDGVAVNLAGGTHHAATDHGEGYCVWNDSAVAIRTMQAEGRIRRALVIDCDVHQGNGTAAILGSDPSVFTLSLHGENNFPFRKVMGDLDIGLADGTGDEVYLDTLEIALERSLCLAGADLVIYIAGADPYEHDRLGKLALTKAGLAARDRMVMAACRAEGLPVVVTMGGGYAESVDDIADIHLQTVRIAAEQLMPQLPPDGTPSAG